MFDKVLEIIDVDTCDLKRLARAAGADYRTFWIGADFRGVDLRGQDLTDLDLTDASFTNALIDETTKLPSDSPYVSFIKAVDPDPPFGEYRLSISRRHDRLSKREVRTLQRSKLQRIEELIHLGTEVDPAMVWDYMREFYSGSYLAAPLLIKKSDFIATWAVGQRYEDRYFGEFIPSIPIFLSGLLNAGIEIERQRR